MFYRSTDLDTSPDCTANLQMLYVKTNRIMCITFLSANALLIISSSHRGAMKNQWDPGSVEALTSL